MASFGEWLKELRSQRKMSQLKLARAMGVDQTTISKVEIESRPPTADFAILLARVMELDRDFVFGKAGLAGEEMEADEQRNSELLSIYKRLSDDDQIKLLEIAKAIKSADDKLKKAKPSPKTART